jgi:putative peptidoglycan lipid II flippase
MIGRIFTVGGFTLLSRLTGFARDIVLAALLGAGPIADAFFVALRLPNHFRAIFAEGAFNAAFVPAYARIRQQGGPDPARLFADRVFVLLLMSQLVLLAVALAFTPAVISLLARGFAQDPERFALATELTRITFPYLLLVSLVTLYGGILNALGRFATAAAAPILLNLSMMAALALVVFFPTPGHAAAWGVLIAGVLEALMVGGDLWRSGDLPRFRWPRLDTEVKLFLRRFGPATLGSAETQIALLADTFIASYLAAGALSAIYYADRLNQLPVGVIALAVGTVLLPEMANRLAAGDERDAAAAAATLAAYAVGLFPFVLLRSVTITFLARGDTWTPVKALFGAVLVNVALKIALWKMTMLAQVGLALATAAGAWINLALLIWFAARQGLLTIDDRLKWAVAKFAIAGFALAAVLYFGERPIADLFAHWPALRAEATLAVLAVIGAVVYFGVVLALFGKQWLKALRRGRNQGSEISNNQGTDS